MTTDIFNTDCIPPQHPFEKPIPIKDSVKESSFYPEIQSFMHLDGKYRNEKDFYVEFCIQTGLNNSCQFNLTKWTDIKTTLTMLKDLNRLSHDLIKFIERNELQQQIN